MLGWGFVVGRPVADDEWSGGDEERENRVTGGGYANI
jgi:hypothetical protein